MDLRTFGYGCDKISETLLIVGQLEKIMFALFSHRRASAIGAAGLNKFGRVICSAADFAGVAVLVRRLAPRAYTANIAVGQEYFALFAIRLLYFSFNDRACLV